MRKHLQMKSYQNVIELIFVVAIFLILLGPNMVEAANCAAQKNFTCVATDFTLPSCNLTTLICDCKHGYVPIPTGCTEKLSKPEVQVEYGRSNEFLPGKTVKLTCFTSESGDLTYEWKKDGKSVFIDTEPEYEFTGDDTVKTGNFSCLIKVPSISLVSEESDPVEMKPVNSTAVTPEIDISSLPKSAAPGALLDVRCLNIPCGATYKFYINSIKLTENVTQDSANINISCVLDNVDGIVFQKNISEAVKWSTKDATVLSQVIIEPSRHLTYKTGTTVNFTCSTVPDARYLEVGSNKISFVFEDTGNLMASTAYKYTVNSTVGESRERTIACNAKYGANKAISSPPVTLTLSDDFIPNPKINASKRVFKIGERLVLACGEAQSGVTYSWTKDGTTITRQKDSIIQIGNFQATDAGRYRCTTAKGNYYVTSRKITIFKSSDGKLLTLNSAIFIIISVSVSSSA